MLAFHNNVDKINKISFFVFCMIVIQIIRDIVSGKGVGGYWTVSPNLSGDGRVQKVYLINFATIIIFIH